MRRLREVAVGSIIQWLPLAVLTCVICATIYVAVQQSYRGSANDPQIQMALDARDALAAGAPPQSLVPSTTVDISHSLAPYLAIYDLSGQLTAASATLHGAPLVPPSGVFTAARSSGMDLVTWMPEIGVREAIAVVPYANGYVLAGRSLRLVEEREDNLVLLVGAGGAAALVVTFVATVISRLLAPLVPGRNSATR